MIRTFEQRHSQGGIAKPCGLFGGDSSSSNTTNTQTVSTDKRQVLDNGSVGITTDGGGATFTSNTTDNSYHLTTDQGAVSAGRDIALAGIGTNSTNIDHLLSTADHLLSQQQQSMQTSADLTRSLAGTAAGAYSDAANQASGNKQLILAAMAVVGVVAFSSLRK
jgi:hypothetical protein